MAYNLRRINVLDLKPSTGIGVALPFNAPGVFRTVYTTKEQLKYNIINYLLTNNRERLYNPNFGANIRAQLFEQINSGTFDTLEFQLRVGLERYFPNITIVTLTVSGDPDRNIMTIEFSYRVNNTGESDNVIIDLNG